VSDRGIKIQKTPVKDDLLPIRLGVNEWMGAMGDLGTFIPIFLSLVALNGLPPARALFLTGLVYIASSLYFRLPVPVQPLKAMGAIAIAKGLGMPMIAAAGLWMGLILLILAVTGRIDWLLKYFSRPIVKGIQLGVGLMLIKTSVSLFTKTTYPFDHDIQTTISHFPDTRELLSALWLLVLPQLPLTLGNAVYAVSDVARDYYGEKARRASPSGMAVSLGLSNLVIGSLGGLPVCHGSGGLTAHYRFGARTCGATLVAGGIFILVSLVFVGSGDLVFQLIPPWILGGMLLYVGICHVLLIRGLESKRLLVWSMGLVGIATSNLLYALILGLISENFRGLLIRLRGWGRAKDY
jgi:MFS superfamily sulfate permease-like transporter